jgi:hypothetical protein
LFAFTKTYAVKQTLARCIHCVWGHKKCEFLDGSERVSVEVVEPAETLGARETRKRAALNTSPRGGKGKKKAREVSAGETTAVEDPPARRRRRPVYGEEHGTIEVDDTAWVAVANNLVVVGGDTLRFLCEWEERAREWRDEDRVERAREWRDEDRVEREMYRAQVARAESSLQATVRELHELESSACAERRAAERAHSEAHVELIEIQREMLDVLKELRDQNKDADGVEEQEEEEEEEEEKDEGKGKGKAKDISKMPMALCGYMGEANFLIVFITVIVLIAIIATYSIKSKL